jgi:hypothetical protein
MWQLIIFSHYLSVVFLFLLSYRKVTSFPIGH